MKGEFFAVIRPQPSGSGRPMSSDILASKVRLVARAKTPTASQSRRPPRYSGEQRSLTAHQVWSTYPFDREVCCQPAWMVLVGLSREGSGVTGIAIAAVAASRLP